MVRHQHRVNEALDLLTRELAPFVEERLRVIYGERWQSAAKDSFRRDKSLPARKGSFEWDAQSLLTVMWDQWNSLFRSQLGHIERSLVSELREFRNRWAHQVEFTFDDTYRVMDSVQRLVTKVNPAAGKTVAKKKRQLLREEFNRDLQNAREKQKRARTMWRNVVIFLVCAAALLFAIFNAFGTHPLAFWASFAVVLMFSYFTYETVTDDTPMFGPHECARCSRIIYDEPCPYCAYDRFGDVDATTSPIRPATNGVEPTTRPTTAP